MNNMPVLFYSGKLTVSEKLIIIKLIVFYPYAKQQGA